MQVGATSLAAAELRFDALVAEALGLAAPRDLADRIVASLRAGPRTAPRSHRLLTALLCAAGVAVAIGVAWLERDRRSDPAPALATAQEPQQPQKPDADAKVKAEVERLVRELELPQRRGATLVALQRLGPAALPVLREARTSEQARGRKEVLDAIQQAIRLLDPAELKAAFGLPPGEVTVVADYSDNRITFVDAKGTVLHTITDVYGAWDAELTPQGTVLLTEFSVSRVQEMDPKGATVWSYEGLKNPYRASRLPDGNTLIADTFNGRVIELDPKKNIVWSYDKDGVRPFGATRLANGNTLIADAAKERVLEVTPAGETVWQVHGMNQLYDAKRLADGNTLITLRLKGQVIEVDPQGNTVWQLQNLNSPSDAVRLPDGHTLVAENNGVREFDAEGKQVLRLPATWAVSVKRY
jgi:hypothetical protein